MVNNATLMDSRTADNTKIKRNKKKKGFDR